jgi:hypothetical protein
LDALLGDNAASTMPTSFELALWDGDPRDTHNHELPSTGGYARVTGITNNSTNFPYAVDGAKTCAVQSLSASTGAYGAIGTYFVLFDSADHTTRYFFGPLTDPVVVSVTGTGVAVQPIINWNTES